MEPLANVEMEVDGLLVKVEAAVSGRLPVAVLLGKDVSEMDQLLGSAEPSGKKAESSKDTKSHICQEEAMVVVTRAQAAGGRTS